MHLALKWQQPTISATVCIFYVNQATKEKKNILYFWLNNFYIFNKDLSV